jgi:UDP-N-acetylglucosamine 3-dehydrogenase
VLSGVEVLQNIVTCQNLKLIKRVEIVAVCDIVAERAEKMAEEYGAKAFTDYKEVLKLDGIDAISVCLPKLH